MKKFSLKQTVATAGIALSVTLSSANPVKAASFTFSQGGWEYGGNLSGSFTGDDLNSDGNLETNELSSFKLTFLGNIFTNPFDALGNPISPIPTSFELSYANSFPGGGINFLDFRYSFSTSELVFSSFSVGRSQNRISSSTQGGEVSLTVFPRSPILPYTTSSSLGVVVTPLQRQVPEPSTLAPSIFGGLVFLLRKRVVPSRMIKETTKKRLLN
jgi:hypothetical protein